MTTPDTHTKDRAALAREVKNRLCLDGHLNATLDKIMETTSPDAKFAHLSQLAHTAVDMALAAAPVHATMQPDQCRDALAELVASRAELAKAHDSTPGECPFSDLVKLKDRINAAWAVARAALASTPPQAASAVAEEHAQLMRFYSVDTIDALIAAQERHIQRLQAKLPSPPSLASRPVREG